MFLIVIHHGIVHGLELTGLTAGAEFIPIIRDNDMLLFMVTNCLCIPAVNIFVLISGYFGLKVSYPKITKLLITLFIYTFTLKIIHYAIIGEFFGIIKSLFFLSHSPYWFIIDYLFLMCFAPMINQYIDKSSKSHLNRFITALIIIGCYFGFIWRHEPNYDGYNVVQFITMYCTGRYIKKYNINCSKAKSACMYISLCVTCGVLMYLLHRIGKNEYSWRITHYNNPLIMLAAVYAILFFKNIHAQSKFINKIAASALAIYLIQSSPLVEYYLYEFIKNIYCNNLANLNGGLTILTICFISFAICIISILLDQVQRFVNNQVYSYLSVRWKLLKQR
jgi:hypothetical protein